MAKSKKKKKSPEPKRSGVKARKKDKTAPAGSKATGSKSGTPKKAVSNKRFTIADFDAALEKEINRTQRKKARETEKRKELNEVLRELQELSGIKLPRVKKDGTLTQPVYPKKRKISKALLRRNAISTMLRRHIHEKHIDLIVYRIVNTETKELVFEDQGKVDSKMDRYNLVLKNILWATAKLDLKTIEYSFDFVFKEDSGLKPKITRTFEEYFTFYNACDVFEGPAYTNVKLKISVYIPFTHGIEYYRGADDPNLPDVEADLDCYFGIFTVEEFKDWFHTSQSYRLCRDWDEANGSDYGIVEFGLHDRDGDEMVHYHLTIYQNYFERYQKKEGKRNDLPLPPAKITTTAQADELRSEISILKEALQFLEEEDREVVQKKIEDNLIELTMLERQKTLPVKEKPAEGLEIEKEKNALEKIRLELDDKERQRQHELDMAKIQHQESMAKHQEEMAKFHAQEDRMKMMKEMVAKGFTFDQIKALLGTI